MVTNLHKKTCWLLILALVGVAFGNNRCPDAKQFAPCTCDEEGVNCMHAKSIDEIKRAFRVPFHYGSKRSVWVQGTPIKSIPGDLFGDVKSEKFFIEVNDIETVDLNALRASNQTVSLISFFGNKIVDFPFQQLSMFENLGTLNLGRNKIESIPSNAINSRSLWILVLAQNKIKHIGENAFSNLPKLGRLQVSVNQISTLGPMSFGNIKTSDKLQINLLANQIKDVDPTAFEGTDPYIVYLSQNKLETLKKEPFQELVTKIAQKGGYLEVAMNPLTCCGQDYHWIMLNKDLLAGVLSNFQCKDKRSIHTLTRENINC